MNMLPPMFVYSVWFAYDQRLPVSLEHTPPHIHVIASDHGQALVAAERYLAQGLFGGAGYVRQIKLVSGAVIPDEVIQGIRNAKLE